ncbi:MAG: hypothetical protein ACREBS_03900 [Nitrososphaerales archaeon]
MTNPPCSALHRLSGYNVLVLKEVAYLDNEDQGQSTLRFLSVDDDRYTVEVPIRDPDPELGK